MRLRQIPRALQQEQAFQESRQGIALFAALLAAIIAAAIAGVSFYDQPRIPMYESFPEWQIQDSDVAPQQPSALDAYLEDLIYRVRDTFVSYFESLNNRHVAGFARFWAILATLVVVPFTYRWLLLERYALEGKTLHEALVREQVNASNPNVLPVEHIAVGLTAMAGCYVFHSALWVLFAYMFEGLTFPVGGAALVTGFAVGLTTFIAVHWALAVTIRDLFTFGLLTFVIGLGGAFAIVDTSTRTSARPTHWWQHAVSEVGQTPNAALFFTFTLVSFGVVMLLFWRDFHPIVCRVLTAAYAHPAKAQRRTSYIRIGFGGAIIGLIGLGVFPLMRGEGVNALTTTITAVLHTGGAVVAMALFMGGGMLVLPFFIPRAVFPFSFKLLSWTLTVLFLVFLGLFAAHATTGFGILKLTAFELLTFGIVGVWLIGAVDLVLDYAKTLPAVHDVDHDADNDAGHDTVGPQVS